MCRMSKKCKGLGINKEVCSLFLHFLKHIICGYVFFWSNNSNNYALCNKTFEAIVLLLAFCGRTSLMLRGKMCLIRKKVHQCKMN